MAKNAGMSMIQRVSRRASDTDLTVISSTMKRGKVQQMECFELRQLTLYQSANRLMEEKMIMGWVKKGRRDYEEGREPCLLEQQTTCVSSIAKLRSAVEQPQLFTRLRMGLNYQQVVYTQMS